MTPVNDVPKNHEIITQAIRNYYRALGFNLLHIHCLFFFRQFFKMLIKTLFKFFKEQSLAIFYFKTRQLSFTCADMKINSVSNGTSISYATNDSIVKRFNIV